MKECNNSGEVFVLESYLKVHQNYCNGGENMIRVKPEEQPKSKCVLKGSNGEETEGHCEHGPEYHSGGLCWFLVNPKLKDQPTNEKYCGCKIDPKAIRSFESIQSHEGKGWMEPEKCKECRGDGMVVISKDPITKELHKKVCTYCDGRGTHDLLITKECLGCTKILLIRVDQKMCNTCESSKRYI